MTTDDLDHEARSTLFDEPDPRQRRDGRDDTAVFAPPALLPRIVRRWKPVLAVGVLAAVVGAGVGLASPTVYTAQALVELGPGASDLVTGTPSAQQDIDRRVATETEIITSDRVRAVAEGAVGEDLPDVQVAQATTSSLLGVSVTTDDPESAAADADAYVDAYIQLASDRTVAQLDPAIEILRDRLTSIGNTLTGLRDLLPPSAEAGGSTTPRTDALLAQYDNALEERSTTKERIDQLEGAAAIGNLDVRSFADAVPPSSPSSTPPLRLALLALLVGLVAGAVVAAAVPLGARRRPRA